MSEITATDNEKLYYRVGEVAHKLAMSPRSLYYILDDEELKIDQRKGKGRTVKLKNGEVIAKSSMRRITPKGLQQLIDLIEEEKI